MPPVVSVIISCFDGNDPFREAIASALAQTVSDIEVIAIDDVAAGRKGEILQDIDDSRLTWVSHYQKRGTAKTINEGIRRARGTYISFLDAADRYHSERLEYCHAIAETNEAVLLGTDLELITQGGEARTHRSSPWLAQFQRLKDKYLEDDDLITTLITGNLFATTSNFFFHRRVFESIGPLSETDHVDGYDFLLRTLAAYPEKAHWVQHNLLFHRLNEEEVANPRDALQTLSRWIPHLATGHRAHQRLSAFSSRVLELTANIELESAQKLKTQWQSDVESYQQVIRETEAQLQAASPRTEKVSKKIGTNDAT